MNPDSANEETMKFDKLNALNVLLGDDESKTLEKLGRDIAAIQKNWNIRIARTSSSAIKAIQENDIDLIITDMKAVDKLGPEFLALAKRDHPKILRILLHGEEDQEILRKATGLAHRYLLRPVQVKEVLIAIRQVFVTQTLIQREKVCKVVEETHQLHVDNTPLQELLASAEDPECDIEKLGKIVSKHPTAHASILQVANTAFFGAGGRVETINEALQMLGMDFVRSLAIAELAKKQLNLSPQLQEIANGILQHSIETSQYALQMKQFVNDVKLVQLAASITLLHDLGKLVLLAKEGNAYADILGRSMELDKPCWRVEQATLGCDHASVGAHLFYMWGLPEAIIRTVAWHHDPRYVNSGGFCPVALVHFANYAAHSKRDMLYYRGDDLNTELASKLELKPDFPLDFE